jgi:DNA-binding protein YbaB
MNSYDGGVMGVPISIRVDDEIREELEMLRDLVTEAARQAKRARIRQASAAIGAHVAASQDAQAFYEEWGTPRADAG